GVEEGSSALLVQVQHPSGDLSVAGGVIHEAVRVIVEGVGLPARGAGVGVAAGRGAGLGFGEVGGIMGVEPGGGVGVLAVGAASPDLEMQMRSGAVAGGADVADVLAGGDGVAGLDVDAGLPHVPVRGRDGLPVEGVFDDDEPAVAAGELGD